MVEIVNSNFEALFPLVEECVHRSEFIAVDTEFTGLRARLEDEPSFFDSMDERYQQLRRFASAYSICQFGLSAFIKEQDENKYIAHSFNFYLFPRQQYVCLGIQSSNAEFLCEHKFDFNKMFYEGITYMNSRQEKDLLTSASDNFSEKEHHQAIGFTRVFRLLQRAQKPLLGHNMLNDLILVYEKFYEPLPDSYSEFEKTLHQLFPIIIDTKHLCYAFQKPLSRTNLLEFSSLVDLYEALGSERGTFYVLCSPVIAHAEESQHYTSQSRFHEAGFDAFCVGYVFLRILHLVAMKGVKSTESHPVHIRQYFRIANPHMNRINIIRGPITFLDLSGSDPLSSRSDWLIVTCKDGGPVTVEMLQEHLDYTSMDVRFPFPNTALLVLSSKKRAEKLLSQTHGPHVHHLNIRRYSWLRDSPTGRLLIWKILVPGLGMGLLGMVLGLILPRYKSPIATMKELL